jgi:Sortase and related acyltransferases
MTGVGASTAGSLTRPRYGALGQVVVTGQPLTGGPQIHSTQRQIGPVANIHNEPVLCHPEVQPAERQDEFLLTTTRLGASAGRNLLAQEKGILVAEVDGSVAGFAGLGPTRDRDEDPATIAEIAAIYLAPEVWGAGIGSRLMMTVLETFAQAGYEQATLWVLDTNVRARRFYETKGLAQRRFRQTRPDTRLRAHRNPVPRGQLTRDFSGFTQVTEPWPCRMILSHPTLGCFEPTVRRSRAAMN